MRKLVAVVAVALLAWSGCAISHGGALDSAGCHTDHKTGVYHCHR